MKYPEQQKRKCFEKIAEINASLPQYAAAFINAKATHKDTSYRTGLAYAYDIQTFFRYLKEKKNVENTTADYLATLTPSDIEEYIQSLSSYETEDDKEYNKRKKEEYESLRKEGVKTALPPKRMHRMGAAARARNLAAIRGLYKHMIKNGMLRDNPAALADTPKTQTKKVIRLDQDEVKRVIENVKETRIEGVERTQFAKRQNLRDYALISLLLYTGIRVSECAGIDLSDIDFEKKSVLVRRKGGDDEAVFFNNEVSQALQDYINISRTSPDYDPDALFITRRNERMSTQAIENVVKKYTNGVSVNNISAHKLRSTYATRLYEITNDAMKVKDALGHKSMGVVQKYIDSAEANRKEASEDIQY